MVEIVRHRNKRRARQDHDHDTDGNSGDGTLYASVVGCPCYLVMSLPPPISLRPCFSWLGQAEPPSPNWIVDS